MTSGDVSQKVPDPFCEGSRILLRSRRITLGLDLRQGGRLLELSDKSVGRNLLDIQSERRGGGRPAAPMVYAFRPGASVRQMARGTACRMKGLFGARWKGKVRRRSGTVQAVIETRGLIRFRRTIILRADSGTITFAERLENPSRRAVAFLFGAALALNLKDAHVNRVGEAEGLRRFAVVDPAVRMEVQWDFSRPARLWHFPLETRSGPDGTERAYRGVSLTALWAVVLRPKGAWAARWDLTIESPDGIDLLEEARPG